MSMACATTSGRTCLELDAVSVRNLELVEPLFSGESAQTTLFYTLDACCTPMGKRLLAGYVAAACEWFGRD
jgi:DNA mismatch repair ATPase MutS